MWSGTAWSSADRRGGSLAPRWTFPGLLTVSFLLHCQYYFAVVVPPNVDDLEGKGLLILVDELHQNFWIATVVQLLYGLAELCELHTLPPFHEGRHLRMSANKDGS